ncbi:hypothetical protein SAMN02745866_00555 [Alteromonadaceae bacterium Bs31]|nr:hypothetical protein SAMN02745866_00555 [Alteromonadaceae bacterium Bs31]
MNHIKNYKPPLFLLNNHLQVALSSSALRRKAIQKHSRSLEINATPVLVESDCGVKLTAVLNSRDANKRKHLIIMLHGWEGSVQSSYMISSSNYLLKNGFDVLRLNFRDHGNSHALNKEIFNSSRHQEIIAALNKIQQQYAYKQYALLGFSLGGNFALRVASIGSKQLSSEIAAVFSICPPIDPKHTTQALERGPRWYESYFVKKWKTSLLNKLEYFPEYAYREALLPMTTLGEMNEYFIPRYTPFTSVDDYFLSYTLTNDILGNINCPTTIVAAKDDPIIPISDFEHLEGSDRLTIEVSERGSHCAYLLSLAGPSWADRRALQFFKDVLC